MSALHAVILGLVEGVTEFLPISSTGHLMLASRLLGLATSEFLKSFEIAIQCGAIAAVIWLYGRRLLVQRALLKRVTVAFLPTMLLGAVWHRTVKTYLLGNHQVVLWAMFAGGILLILFERWHREPSRASEGAEAVSYRQALLIGVCQAAAMVPGVSRSGATIIGGLALGVRRAAIVEFSFLLAVPTMLAATGLDLLKSASTFSADQLHLLIIGGATSFLVALASIRWLLRYIQRHDFTMFGVYRIVAALVFWMVI